MGSARGARQKFDPRSRVVELGVTHRQNGGRDESVHTIPDLARHTTRPDRNIGHNNVDRTQLIYGYV